MATDPNASPLLVSARGVSVARGGQDVLQSVDVDVRAGEIVTLIGPNGAGKSTLAHVILGLLSPREGTVERRTGLRIGYVPQTVHVDRTMPLTARRFLQLSPWARKKDLARSLADAGAPDVLDRPFQDLSGGETKRVLLARALLPDPELLVLDEPTASIDVSGQAEFYDLIRGIRDSRQCGVLLVSHDLHLVMAATDTVLCLNGHVCCSGAPAAVSRDPAYLALFGPGVSETLGIYTHAHDHRHDLHGAPVPHGDRRDAPERAGENAGG